MAANLDFGWSICEKLEIVMGSCEDSSDIILVQIHSEVVENCHFHVFAFFFFFFYDSQQPSCIAQSHKVGRTSFADPSD